MNKEMLREEIKKRIEYTVTSGENFDFATNLILELFDQHLERLAEKITRKFDIADSHGHEVELSDVLVVIKKYD